MYLIYILIHRRIFFQTDFTESEWLAYFTDHIARLRDVELLTGLRFIPEFSSILRPSKEASYATEIWSRPSWFDQNACENIECPAGYGIGR